MSEEQARAEVQAISLAFSQVIEKQVATKSDISSVKEELYAVKEELKQDINRLERGQDDLQAEQRLIKWMVGISLIISLAMLPMMVAILLYLLG